MELGQQTDPAHVYGISEYPNASSPKKLCEGDMNLCGLACSRKRIEDRVTKTLPTDKRNDRLVVERDGKERQSRSFQTSSYYALENPMTIVH